MNNEEKITFLLQVMGEVNAELASGNGRIQMLPLTTVFKALEFGVTALRDCESLRLQIEALQSQVPAEVP